MSLILFIAHFILEAHSESFWELSFKQDSILGSGQGAVSGYTKVLLIELNQNSKQDNKWSRASLWAT